MNKSEISENENQINQNRESGPEKSRESAVETEPREITETIEDLEEPKDGSFVNALKRLAEKVISTLEVEEDYVESARVILIRDRKVLLVLAKNHDTFSLPGGRLDKGENPVQAVIREVKEELNLSISENNLEEFGIFHGHHGGKNRKFYVYTLKNIEQEPVATSEIIKLEWTDSQILGLRLKPIVETQIIPELKKRNLID